MELNRQHIRLLRAMERGNVTITPSGAIMLKGPITGRTGRVGRTDIDRLAAAGYAVLDEPNACYRPTPDGLDACTAAEEQYAQAAVRPSNKIA